MPMKDLWRDGLGSKQMHLPPVPEYLSSIPRTDS